MEQLKEEKDYKIFSIYLKGIILFFCISLSLIFVLSILLSLTNIQENIISPAIIFISMISILIPSFFLSKKINKKGIINGAIFGIICMLLLYIISSFINMKFNLNVNSIFMLFLGIIGGMIGGILGVNTK